MFTKRKKNSLLVRLYRDTKERKGNPHEEV